VLNFYVQVQTAFTAVDLVAKIVGTGEVTVDGIGTSAVVFLAPVMDVAFTLHLVDVLLVESLNRKYFLKH